MSKKKEKVRCPECGVEPMRVHTRMAEMPPDFETKTRIWKRIGRTWYHQGGMICDEPLAEVTDVVRRSEAPFQ